MKKLIKVERWWDSTDWDEPITDEGWCYIFNDNSFIKVSDNDENFKFPFEFEKATEEDKKDYEREFGYTIYTNDIVEVVKGRKFAKGSKLKIVNSYVYTVPNTYNKIKTLYLITDKGEKIDSQNVINSKGKQVFYFCK